MAVELHEQASGKFLLIRLSGKLTKEDYQEFVPEVERLIEQHGKLRIVMEMHDFHGWTAGALWQDVKFDLKHFRHIERLAMIGDRAWEHGMAIFCKPFTTAKVRYFDADKAEEAQQWIHEDLPAGTANPAPKVSTTT